MKEHKLLVGRTRHLAMRAAEAFGIDSKEWMIEGIGCVLAGRRFEKIIVLPIVDPHALESERGWRREWVEHLVNKLHPDKLDQLFILD